MIDDQGFVYESRQYRLVFKDPAMAGLVVVMRGRSVEQTFELQSVSNSIQAETTEELRAELQRRYDYLAGGIVEWNLQTRDDDGNVEPVEPSAQAFWERDAEFSLTILREWHDAVMGLKRPLSEPSKDGDTSLVLDLPMEPLSESPQS